MTLPAPRAPRCRDGISIESLSRICIEVIQQAGGGRVHLAGHSLGTIICQHYAAAHPDRVASLSLIGGFPAAARTGARNALRDRAAKVRAEGMAAIADAIVAAGTSDDTKIQSAGGDRLRAREHHGATR